MAKRKRQPTWEEVRASEIVGAELGVTLTVLDEPPRQNFADFTIERDENMPGVMEVTQHADPTRTSLSATMRRKQDKFPRTELTKLWCVYLPPLNSSEHLRYTDVVANLDNLVTVLGVWEARGEVRADPGNPLQRNEVETLHRLGVDWVMALEPKDEQPGVLFMEPGGGGASGTPAVVAAALSEARKDDNGRKLEKATGDGQASSRHLFVWIAPSQAIAYFALSDRQLPTTAPDLPPYVTDLWIAGRYDSGEVVWRWDGTRWSDVVTPEVFPQ